MVRGNDENRVVLWSWQFQCEHQVFIRPGRMQGRLKYPSKTAIRMCIEHFVRGNLKTKIRFQQCMFQFI